MFKKTSTYLGIISGLIGLLALVHTSWADPPMGDYEVTFTQITSGSGFAVSALYRVEDSIKTQGALGATQSSADYEIVNPVGKESVTVPVEVSAFVVD